MLRRESMGLVEHFTLKLGNRLATSDSWTDSGVLGGGWYQFVINLPPLSTKVRSCVIPNGHTIELKWLNKVYRPLVWGRYLVEWESCGLSPLSIFGF